MDTLLANLNLTGSEAGQAMRTIMSMEGRVLFVTPLKDGGETIWFILPNGKVCTIGTNPVPSYSGVYGDYMDEIDNFTAALGHHLKALRQAGVPLGYSPDELLAIPA